MSNTDDLGPPDLAIARFALWVRGRQFEAAEDYWDGNWLQAAANCASPEASAWARGPIVHLSEVVRWRDQLQSLHQSLTGSAQLGCMEPNFNACITLKAGSGVLVVHIAHDHLTEKHEFRMDVDQSHLPALIRQIDALLTRYPLRGTRES